MGRGALSDVAYTSVAEKAKKAGSATHEGERRQQQGLGLHELVDPAGFELIRRSISWLEPEDDHFVLLRGVAMLEETRLDTTASMGNNVDIAMEVLPKTYKLLSSGEAAVLARYDLQMITSIFGDIQDAPKGPVLCRSQAEMDERIAAQMTLMVPVRDGGDVPEDPQYGIFGGAYLTAAGINRYGLKYYDFTVSDAPGRHEIRPNWLLKIFGPSVFEKVAENGFQIDRKNVPSTKQTVASLLERAHAFFLQVGSSADATSFWRSVFGFDRCVIIPRVKLLPYVKAAIIGLTEGTLDLQTLEDYLRYANMSAEDARAIKRAVAHIPIGAQMALPNFDKIPLRGAKFAKKGDIWPIGTVVTGVSAPAVAPETEETDMWL